MRILALETSTLQSSLALSDGENVVSLTTLEPKQRTAQSLAPAIKNSLQLLDWSPKSLDLIALSSGPGSFTGLRIGVTTAKMLAYATNAEILGLDSLEVIALQSPSDSSHVVAIMDAQRQQLYAASFQRSANNKIDRLSKTTIADQVSFLDSLASQHLLTGPGVKCIRDRLPVTIKVAEPALWAPRADTVARLANAAYARGKRDDLWQLVPQYFRKSAAEEKVLQKPLQ